MTDEEKYILERVGRVNPFTVPDGYFDHLADQLTAQLPEAKTVALRPARRRVWYAAAIALLAVALSATVYFVQSSQQPALAEVQQSADSYMDEMADYAMLDNTDIYACLAEN